MKYIESLVILRGAVSRKRVSAVFGVADACVTRDILRYSQAAPGRIKYNHYVKEHQVMTDFKPHYFNHDRDWIEQAKEFQEAVHTAFGVITI